MATEPGVRQLGCCAVNDPHCPSIFDGGVCDCDSDPDGTVLEEYRIRAQNAERALLGMVRAVRRGNVSEEMLQAATRVAMKHEA
ncbi:hypothetical protein [Burkholderia vietnamiensis]|uniref:hypothetical protein n=1 Tax=Burkholderia vietnamiensis TaxID=60552 RepID=UPI001CF0F8B9|nr:hypothetical protein [Burkholderia vietnamiensis]MCA8228236.1 hypothetical protein [Burkholderia vietnamiensis]